MKQLMIMIVLTTVLFACSDNSTGPDNNDDTGPTVSETIGSAGGTVAIENITLTVPSGSFAVDETIGITEIRENDYGDNAVSKTYLLSGIPADFTVPLTLILTYSGELSNETYIVAEENATGILEGITQKVPFFIPATAFGDSVTGVLLPRASVPGKPSLVSDEKEVLDFYITVVTDYITDQSASHIVMKAPNILKNFTNALVPRLEEVYNLIDEIGFDFTIPGHSWGAMDTIYVYVDLDDFMEDNEDDIVDPPVFQGFLPINDNNTLTYLEISKYAAYPSMIDEVVFDATRSLGVLTAVYYSPPDRKPTLWFDIAMGDWLARKWHDTGVIASPVTQNPTLALGGIPVISSINRVSLETLFSESRRFLPLFSYLDSRYNFTGSEHTLADIYEERYNGADIPTSIETVTGLEPSEWWPDFVEAYITGEVWDIDPIVFLQNSSQKGYVTLSVSDTTHTFTGEFGDLAADIYRVSIDASYAENISTLSFTAESSGLQDEYLTVLLFGVRSNKPYYIGRGINSVITDAGEASDTNTFLAVVTSSLIDYPYHDDTNYSLTVTGAGDTNDFYQIVVQLPYVSRNYEWVDNDGPISPAGGAGGPFTWTINIEDTVRNGDTYTGQIVTTMNSDTWGHYKTTSTVSATITSAEASATVTQVTEDYETDTTTTQTFEFGGLPRIEPMDIFTVSYGSTTEQYMANEHWPNFVYTYHREANVDPEGYTRESTYFARGANIHLR